MSIASSIPTLAEGIHVHDRKLLGYAWDGISGSPTICGSIRVFSRSLFSKFGHEIFERKRRRKRERERVVYALIIIMIIKQMVCPTRGEGGI